MRRAAAAALCSILLACGSGDRPAPAGESVSFTTDDGVELAGEILGDGEVGVVLMHMFPADRRSWVPFAARLAEEGYTALAFDFRGYGDSGGEREIAEIWRDAVAAVRFMRGRGFDRIALVGASMGGTAALIVAVREDLDAVVTLSAPTSFMGLTIPPEALELIDEPKLFVASQGDTAAATSAQQMHGLVPAPKEVEIVAGGAHGTELLRADDGGADRLIVEFLAAEV